MGDWVQRTIEAMGYPGIVLLMFVENVFPPIPSEVVMPYAGFAAARGELTLWGVIAAGAAGSVLGALPLYYLGRWLGDARLRDWSARHGHWLMLAPGDLARAERWFDRQGSKTVFFCRLVPGVRSLISIPAGVYEMPLWRFLLWTAAGTALWAGLLAWGGEALGERYDRIGRWVGPLTWIVLGGLLLWYVVYVWRRKRARRASG